MFDVKRLQWYIRFEASSQGVFTGKAAGKTMAWLRLPSRKIDYAYFVRYLPITTSLHSNKKATTALPIQGVWTFMAFFESVFSARSGACYFYGPLYVRGLGTSRNLEPI